MGRCNPLICFGRVEYLTRRASSQGFWVLGDVLRHHDRFGLCVGLRGRTLGSTVRGVSGGKRFVQALKKKKSTATLVDLRH